MVQLSYCGIRGGLLMIARLADLARSEYVWVEADKDWS